MSINAKDKQKKTVQINIEDENFGGSLKKNEKLNSKSNVFELSSTFKKSQVQVQNNN